MKLYLKLMPAVLGFATFSQYILAADVTTYPTYTPNSYVPPTYSVSNSISTSNAGAVALNAQALLLREMEQEHQKRAANLTQKNETDKAKWESDLVNELHDRSVRVQKGIDQVTQPSGTSEMKSAADVDEKLIFVSAVEARLEQLRQELSGTIEGGRVLSMQIGTNKAPDDIANLSMALGENQKMIRQLQKEQVDLELRKLEFQALCKAMQR